MAPISEERKAAQSKYGKIGCLTALILFSIVLVLYAVVPHADEAALSARGSIEQLTVTGDRINVSGLVNPSDVDEAIVPAISQILEEVRARSEPKGVNPTRLPIPLDQTILLSVKLRAANGTENDFGNIELPLMALYTAPAGKPLALLELVTNVEAGSGPGINRGVAWCRASNQAELVPKFCAQVEAASS